MNKLKFGIIGLSEGNGHPYSWSAIFNGYKYDVMKECPFPVIPDYLSKHKYPDDFLTNLGNVSAVWTQDIALSNHIATASEIKIVCERIEDLAKYSDAILLARDDAEKHVEMASVFIKKGIPIFVDKPFALNVSDAEKMLSLQKYETQIFTCSSLRYAEELKLTVSDKNEIGEITLVEAFCPKYWETYGIHLIEPIIMNCPERGKLVEVHKVSTNPRHSVSVKWENLTALINMTKQESRAIEIIFHGKKGKCVKTFSDSFNCFKSSLLSFAKQIQTKKQLIPRIDTLETVSIIENGR